ncbi:uncharacterized protein [Physcomitrium patens]|uniref:Uncharacterized protein n=1 Tax=Physcomitrium patens TaxID=3218 RepID=A0A2K1K852_PHYPA|nr:uncharacterized protein LOC112285751 isoform X1 [Physcomitrium patens]PNR49950.1 hypothetical protein PHYPA_011847 [Physcomitrium patens]|eukprot:XP_024382603.1 uncharacterized protein LOC112285751 isoform X1 [Physcomitrella patens]
MGHANPVVGLPRKPDSWRWETSNSEYGKFYVTFHKAVENVHELPKEICTKKCEALRKELQEARAQLEKLQISCDHSLAIPVACQTSPTPLKLEDCCDSVTNPVPLSKKVVVTQPSHELKTHGPQPQLEHTKGHSHQAKCVKQKLALRPLAFPRKVGRNYQAEYHDENNEDMEDCKAPTTRNKLGCELICKESGMESRSSSRGSSKDRVLDTAGKRKIVLKQGGLPKKQKGVAIKSTGSDLKQTAAGGGKIPLTQRYNFYRNYGYAGQGAKTSKGWHSMKTPWMKREY